MFGGFSFAKPSVGAAAQVMQQPGALAAATAQPQTYGASNLVKEVGCVRDAAGAISKPGMFSEACQKLEDLLATTRDQLTRDLNEQLEMDKDARDTALGAKVRQISAVLRQANDKQRDVRNAQLEVTNAIDGMKGDAQWMRRKSDETQQRCHTAVRASHQGGGEAGAYGGFSYEVRFPAELLAGEDGYYSHAVQRARALQRRLVALEEAVGSMGPVPMPTAGAGAGAGSAASDLRQELLEIQHLLSRMMHGMTGVAAACVTPAVEATDQMKHATAAALDRVQAGR